MENYEDYIEDAQNFINSMDKDNDLIYEDDYVNVKLTGHDYDFMAYIENKTDEDIHIEFPLDEMEPVDVPANDWVGIEANEYDVSLLGAFVDRDVEIEPVSRELDKGIEL